MAYSITKIKAGCWLLAHNTDEDKRQFFKTRGQAVIMLARWEAWEAEAAEFEAQQAIRLEKFRRDRVAAYLAERATRSVQLRFEF